MPLAIGLSMLMSAAMSGAQAPAPRGPVIANLPPAQTVEQYVREYFDDIPIMVSIAKCESRFRQFDKNGSIHRGEINSADLGVMQVNEYYHGDTAKKIGLNLYTIEGNLEYARYLYEREGTTPWLSSAKCWDRSAHVAVKN